MLLYCVFFPDSTIDFILLVDIFFSSSWSCAFLLNYQRKVTQFGMRVIESMRIEFTVYGYLDKYLVACERYKLCVNLNEIFLTKSLAAK